MDADEDAEDYEQEEGQEKHRKMTLVTTPRTLHITRGILCIGRECCVSGSRWPTAVVSDLNVSVFRSSSVSCFVADNTRSVRLYIGISRFEVLTAHCCSNCD